MFFSSLVVYTYYYKRLRKQSQGVKVNMGFLFFAENYGVHPARPGIRESPNGVPGRRKTPEIHA